MKPTTPTPAMHPPAMTRCAGGGGGGGGRGRVAGGGARRGRRVFVRSLAGSGVCAGSVPTSARPG